MPKKPTLKSISTKLDKLLRDLIKERADWTCQKCEIKSEDHYFMQWSHHLSCKYKKIRWNVFNAAAHCGSCHERFTGDPVAHREEIYRLIGEEMYYELRRRIDDPKTKAPDLHERILMYNHYKDEYEVLKRKRKDGKQGYIEVKPWD